MNPFVYFLAQGVVMCSEYKHVVLLSHIDAYLEDEGKHEAVKADRARIVQAVQAIRGLKPNRVELNHLVFPRASNIPPIQTLQEPGTDGLQCQL